MKKIATILLCLAAVLVCLGGCSKKQESMQKNLEKAGYTVEDFDESRLSDVNQSLKGQYSGIGTVVSGFQADLDNTSNHYAIAVTFSHSDDMKPMYDAIKAELNDNETIDYRGKTLVYGTKDTVKIALK